MTNYYRGCYIKQGPVPTNEQKMKHLNWFSYGILTDQPFNYFPIVDTYGFIIDAEGNGYLSDNVVPKDRVLVISNIKYGFWYGLQSAPLPITGHIFTISSHADDLGQPTYFFRSGTGTGVWRTAKDGSSDVQIRAGGDEIGGSGFDIIRDRFVVFRNIGGACSILSLNRIGENIESWSIFAGNYTGGVGVFNDGRYVIVRQDGAGNGVAYLYDSWEGTLIQSQTFSGAAGTVCMWVSVDNVNNEVFMSDYFFLFRWVISTNTISVYTGGQTEKKQCAYYNDWVYVKSGYWDMWRYSRDGSIVESWDGSQYLA